jgi:hypothetical protein
MLLALRHYGQMHVAILSESASTSWHALLLLLWIGLDIDPGTEGNVAESHT